VWLRTLSNLLQQTAPSLKLNSTSDQGVWIDLPESDCHT
jgi:hypothetical protein